VTDTPTPSTVAPEFLAAVVNLSRFHREHEQFYASNPREQAVALQRHERALLALADQWSQVEVSSRAALNPFEGAEDLNSPTATQLDGVLFMEGEGEPVEIERMKSDLRRAANDFAATGEWLAAAMTSSWDIAATLIDIDQLSDLLGERHRIIANDWQAANISTLVARILQRAADVLDRIEFTPRALRADLEHDARAPRLLYSTAELIAHAADILSDSAGLVHDNERRWRSFHARVAQLVETSTD
jgi:hypothetical protein